MNILVRLPNWLGDVIMSFPFLTALRISYPEAKISLIVKNGLEQVIDILDEDYTIIPFSKKEHKGLFACRTFGKGLAANVDYDYFFSLPDSFSSAWIGYFSGAKKRIGYKAEARSMLLTETYVKDQGSHRAKQYISLLLDYDASEIKFQSVLNPARYKKRLGPPKYILFNMNSAAESRTLPSMLTQQVISYLLETFDYTIILSGAASDVERVGEIKAYFSGEDRVEDWSGKTNLKQLFQLAAQANMTFTTDSGIGHISNAFGTKTIVLFGAGNDLITRPYYEDGLSIIRKEGLECAPCVSNQCKKEELLCLNQLELATIKMEINAML